MKRNLLASLLLLLVTSPLVQADTNSAGLTDGQINVEDQDSSFAVEADNLGIVAGGIANSGLGFELFYNFTVREDDISVNGIKVAEARITSFGVLGVYQSPGQVYFKDKGGFAVAGLLLTLAQGFKPAIEFMLSHGLI